MFPIDQQPMEADMTWTLFGELIALGAGGVLLFLLLIPIMNINNSKIGFPLFFVWFVAAISLLLWMFEAVFALVAVVVAVVVTGLIALIFIEFIDEWGKCHS